MRISYLILCTSLITTLTIPTYANSLGAILTYDTRVVTPEGVTKTTHFQEQFIRDDSNVWSERIVPAHTQPIAIHEEHDGHEEHDLNFALAGKWIYKNPQGQLTYKLVRSHEKKIIEPRLTEYATLGFDGNWAANYNIVTEQELRSLKKSTRKAPPATQWYTAEKAGMVQWVLWDTEHAFPVIIEQTAKDGTSSTRIQVQYTALPKHLPWDGLTTYQVIAYEDLLD